MSCEAKVNAGIDFDEVGKEYTIPWIYLDESGEETGETVSNQPLVRRCRNNRNPLGRSFSVPPLKYDTQLLANFGFHEQPFQHAQHAIRLTHTLQ